ncbi:uncharacterized protein [Rutidosis leptorrhynchoides]|uniref:uncharacterized protein n=1 Tax=Rutidosis leptorrhynchoides TaxID=125765 RepID=UPI003A99ECF5
MPFGLTNAGATYQRLIDSAFNHQIRRNLEAYVDDLVIKSTTEEALLADAKETFQSLRKINMKLNPLKCSFGEKEGKFLGYVVTKQGIKTNPKKITTIENMSAPKNRKGNFLFSDVKGMFKVKNFSRTAEVDKAFNEMKQLLAEIPMLTAPIAGETLYLYLANINEAFRYVLIAERNKVQKPIYLVIKALTGSEINYAPIEKFVYALLLTARSYIPRTAVKGQILADCLEKLTGELEVQYERTQLQQKKDEVWELFTDGASCIDGTGAGIVIQSPNGEEQTYTLRFNFEVTNNEVEYEALIAGMNIAQKLNIKKLNAYLTQIPRSQNKKADALSKLAALTFSHLQKHVWVKELHAKAIADGQLMAMVEEVEPTWVTPIIKYLQHEVLPAEKKQARLVRIRSPMYWVENGNYRKSYLGPLMQCIGTAQADNVIHEVHDGSCALHSGYKTAVAKIMCLGYFWTSMYRDVVKVVKSCKNFQLYAPNNRFPRHDVIPINSLWPFTNGQLISLDHLKLVLELLKFW